MPNLQLTELACPSCGAPLRMIPQRTLTTCPFCDSQIAAQWAEDHGQRVSLSTELEQRVVPFRADRAAFERTLLEWLAAGDYTPDDVLSRAMVQEHVGLLVPFYRVIGTWKGTFTAAAGFDRTESYVENEARFEDGQQKTVPVAKTRTVTDWRPMSGEASGSYDLLLIASARIPEELRDFCVRQAAQSPEDVPLAPEHLADAVAEPLAQPLPDLWPTLGEPQFESVVLTEIRTRIPGDKAKDIRHTVARTEQQVVGRYQPFWLATYAYDGKRFRFLLDGVHPERSHGQRPEDTARRARVEAFFRPLRTWAIIWGICLIVGFLLVVPAFIAIFVGIPHLIYLYVQADKQKKAVLDASRKVRQDLLARIKPRGLPGAQAP